MATEATSSQGQTELANQQRHQAASNNATPMVVGADVLTSKTAEQAPKKKTLADDVASAGKDDSDVQRPGHIGPLENWRLKRFFLNSLSSDGKIHLGLVSTRYDRLKSRQIKLSHLHSLACRGVDGLDAAEFTRCALRHFKSRETAIRLQHSPQVMRPHEDTDEYDLLEELLLDTAFILEQLLLHWEAGIRPNMVTRPKQYRFDLVQLSNQTPYVLLQELVKMVKIPPAAASKCGGGGSPAEYFLRSIAIGYIVAEQATEWLLTTYTGPVYHLLHLVYLHLASTVEQSPPTPRRSLWARCKVKGRHAFLEAARSAKKALRRASDVGGEHALFQTAWWSYSMIPPAWDLCRVGIRLAPKKGTRCLAAACFQDGVLELPPLELVGFDCQVLINLVALELQWESSRPLFMSYAVFMGELMTTQRDVDLLQNAGVLTVDKSVNSWLTKMDSPEWFFFKLLADLNSGRELHDHFVKLAREMKTSYDHLNSRAAACPRSSCLSG